jgi:NTP pyrophosphatase (non-canonical NTP hydrolase)
MALLHSEVSEAFEDYRDHGQKLLNVIRYEFGGPNDGKPEGFPIELADVFIRLMDTCAGLGIDLDHAVSVKMKYNSTRPYRHNGKFA